MPKSKPSKKNRAAKNDIKHRSTSSYNLYYILERELFLKNEGIEPTEKRTSEEELKNYGDLASLFPPRPSRYESLKLSYTWFLRRSVRYRNRPTKNRVAIPLGGLSQKISSSWKSCSSDVKGYVTAVAAIIKKRFDETAVQDNAKTCDHQVTMVSSSSTISEGASSQSEFVPREVINHNSTVQLITQQQQQLFNMMLAYSNAAMLNNVEAMFNSNSNCINASNNRGSNGLLDVHQLNGSPGVGVMERYNQSTFFGSLPSIDTKQEAGRCVKGQMKEEKELKTIGPWLSEW